MPDDEKPEIVIVDKTLIKPIELDDAQGRWLFDPQADITALEAVLISQMWAAITVRYLKGDQSRFDWREYLTRHTAPRLAIVNNNTVATECNLARHFKSMD